MDAYLLPKRMLKDLSVTLQRSSLTTARCTVGPAHFRLPNTEMQWASEEVPHSVCAALLLRHSHYTNWDPRPDSSSCIYSSIVSVIDRVLQIGPVNREQLL
jgi:hypothetical protein